MCWIICGWCSLQATDNVISNFKIYLWWPENEDTCCRQNLDVQVNYSIINFLDAFNSHFVNKNLKKLYRWPVYCFTFSKEDHINRKYFETFYFSLQQHASRCTGGDCIFLPRCLSFDIVKNLGIVFFRNVISSVRTSFRYFHKSEGKSSPGSEFNQMSH